MQKSKQNVKLLHATKHNPTDPGQFTQLAFTVNDPDTGSERVIVANVPPDQIAVLYGICQEQGWVDDSQYATGTGAGPRRIAA